jgi:hypothetical protein
MDTDNVAAPVSANGFLPRPWPVLLAGLGVNALGLISLQLLGTSALPLVFLGLLLSSAGVALRPGSPAILGTAALSGLLAWGGLDPAWDSVRLLVTVLIAIAAVAAVLMLLPRWMRRLAFSLLILFHFGGIVTAVTSVPPQPWLSTTLWTYVYRPYLEFMYLNNAYHFYSPEPGPATLMWFYVKYDDGTAQWVKVPRKEDYPMVLEYQRRLSLSESINQLLPPGSVSEEVRLRRLQAYRLGGIPMHPEWAENVQYREPTSYSKRMLQTYARYIARRTPHPTDPERKVTGVRIYRVIHSILTPVQVAGGVNPEAPYLFFPYYQGEYTPDGVLKDADDPYLYWLIPILRKGSKAPFHARIGRSADAKPDALDEEVRDYLQLHAAS